jgi:hypothetical protein
VAAPVASAVHVTRSVAVEAAAPASAAALAPTPELKSWMSPREIRRTLYQVGAKAFRDRAKLAWARADSTATTPQPSRG